MFESPSHHALKYLLYTNTNMLVNMVYLCKKKTQKAAGSRSTLCPLWRNVLVVGSASYFLQSIRLTSERAVHIKMVSVRGNMGEIQPYMFEHQSDPDSNEKSVVHQNRQLPDVVEW